MQNMFPGNKTLTIIIIKLSKYKNNLQYNTEDYTQIHTGQKQNKGN